jgi:uncharacterized membrane protein
MSDVNELARVEAYSDGVFAIAATLLILEIRVPSVDPHAPLAALVHELAGLWPSYLAFVISFGTILVIWVNHHGAVRLLHKTSNAFLYANGLLLLTVTFIPFPTALLARYIETDLAGVAVAVYAGSSLLTNVAFLLWFAAMQKPVYLLRKQYSRPQLRKVWMKLAAGQFVYVPAAIVSWWAPRPGLALIVAIFIFWIVMSFEDRSLI